VLAAADARDLSGMSRRIARDHGEVRAIDGWADVADAAPGDLLALRLDAEAGFAADGLALLCAADVLGSRARTPGGVSPAAAPWLAQEADLAEGDVVVHMGHGVGVLRGLETVESEALRARETIRLDYAKDARLLTPVEDMGQVWRYGGDETAVHLDRLDADAWAKRRARIEGEIAETARALIEAARERDATAAPKLVPPRPAYERFVAGFPYATTVDQAAAVDAVLADLASGRPMDRLVIGDVGFGKTEVALRAAAAAALAGKQVAVVAPTTVLVRQHVQTFRKRFADLGIEVAHLSRLATAAEVKTVKAGLEDGSVRVVIGTHTLAGESVSFADLGLLIVDEEQRFGTAHKHRLRELGQGVHVLTLTATPIPRTLQSALVGLQELSVIATPPARRRPVRTFAAPLDEATIRQALIRERARGGQSFVVVPRIEDMAAMAERLTALVPQLTVLQAHGKLPAAEVDEVMVRFAEGDADVLLATNIIESGLDVPRANTMLVHRADLFGLAQLHQLRGRVGRGRAQGVCYLFTDADRAAGEAAVRRLGTLAAFDRLGSGLAISARDLDLRGAGDLTGDDQAGHMKLIGLGLYQHLLALAIRQARGEDVQDWAPQLMVDAPGALPVEYVPEPALRINLYARLARAVESGDVNALADELEDRFGEPPPEVRGLLAHARLRALCRTLGVTRIDAGPQALALTLRPEADAAAFEGVPGLERKGERLILRKATDTAEARLHLATDLLEGLG
jgi:transcription-repair coupling factor (superfamily II helicase)